METVTSGDGVQIAVEPKGTGPAVVWVDPAGAFHGMRPLDDAVAELAAHCTVLTYDRRGRGSSGDAESSSVADEVRDLAAVVAAARGDVTLFGFSSGAALALHAAAAGVPVERVVALEPPVDLDGEPDEAFLSELRGLLEAGRRGEAVEFFNRAIGVPDEMIAGLRHHPAWSGIQALAHTFLYDAAVTDSLTRDVLGNISVPVVVLASEGSDEFLRGAAESVADAVPSARLELLPGGWHGPEPAALIHAILRG